MTTGDPWKDSERYRAALESIVDYEPKWELWEHPDPDCDECAKCRQREWPPSRLCNDHYSSLVRTQNQNARRKNNQYINMKTIAREALNAETAPEGTVSTRG